MEITLGIDVLILTICAALLLCFGRLAHSHPATIYLFFHVYTVTLRLGALLMGAPPLFSRWMGPYEAITAEEFARAAAVADIALIVMTAAFLRVGATNSQKRCARPIPGWSSTRSLRLPFIWAVALCAMPIGLLGMAILSRRPGIEPAGLTYLGEWSSSGWTLITQSWFGLGLLVLIYWYGFRAALVFPMGAYLLFMSLQGYSRMRVVIPILLLAQIYLDRHNRRWPTPAIWVTLIALTVLFFPLKTIGNMAQQGASSADIIASSVEIVDTAAKGQHGDQEFLDQLACALTLIDRNERFYWGTIYLNLLTLPIPRLWWPDKPGLADYLGDFSRASRPMKQSGMIVTYLGESYANFGYWGIIVIAYLLAHGLASAYFAAYRNPYYSVVRFTYLLIACNLILVYRDGLLSLVMFTFVYMMPLMIIVCLHLLPPMNLRTAAGREARGAATGARWGKTLSQGAP